jgi:hypothetical protein
LVILSCPEEQFVKRAICKTHTEPRGLRQKTKRRFAAGQKSMPGGKVCAALKEMTAAQNHAKEGSCRTTFKNRHACPGVMPAFDAVPTISTASTDGPPRSLKNIFQE